MRALTETYLVEGYNRAELIKRLKNGGVALLKVKILSDKLTEITIDSKDGAKYFAICKNMWYNTLVKRGGLLYPLLYAKQNAVRVLGAALIVLCMPIFENVYLGAEYEGDAVLFKTQAERALSDAGIKKYRFFSPSGLAAAQTELSVSEGVSFLSVQKRGNKAVISLKKSKEQPAAFPVLNGDLTALGDCVITKLTVYSGTAVKKAGEEVFVGEKIVCAYYQKSDSERVFCPVIAAYSAKFNFFYEYVPPRLAGASKIENAVSEEDISAAVACAKEELGDKTVLSVDYELKNGKIRVRLQYERSFIGDKEII